MTSCLNVIYAAEFDYGKQPAIIKSQQCIGTYGQGSGHACIGFTSRNNVSVRTAPSEKSEILGTLHFGYEILLLEPFESVEHPGWVMVSATRGDRSLIAWMPRSGVLFRWELHRVVGCWPIAALSWTEEGAGDYDGAIYEPWFDVNGNASGRNERERNFYKDYAIYYANEIFVIYRSTDRAQLAPTFTLDYSKRHVTNNYTSIQKTETANPPYIFAKEEALKGCTQVPRIDLSQPLLQKPIPAKAGSERNSP